MADKASSVFKRIAGALVPRPEKDASHRWEPADGVYPRLLLFDPKALGGRSGVYLIWHLGVRPQWLRVGFASDLGAAAAVLAAAPEIASFSANDGPFLSWCFCPAGEAPSLVNFLANRLKPALQTVPLSCDVILDPAVPATPCALPPGTKDIQPH